MDVRIFADFRFNSHNISSLDGFCVELKIVTDAPLTLQQHKMIRSQMARFTAIAPGDVPVAWGDNPPRYEEIHFYAENNPALCKRLVELLKDGRRQGLIDRRDFTANGYPYPSDAAGDHPLFAKITGAEKELAHITGFDALHRHLRAVVDAACPPANGRQQPRGPVCG